MFRALAQSKLKKECPLTGAYLAYGWRPGNLNSLLALSRNDVPVKSKLLHLPRAPPRAFESLENFGSNFPLTGPNRKAVQMPQSRENYQIAVLTFQ